MRPGTSAERGGPRHFTFPTNVLGLTKGEASLPLPSWRQGLGPPEAAAVASTSTPRFLPSAPSRPRGAGTEVPREDARVCV